MTDREVISRMADFSRYVRFLADRIKLRDWSFDVEFDADLEGSLSTVELTPNRRHAVLAVGPLFFKSSEVDQRHGAVHELVHCHLQPARTFFSTLKRPLGKVHNTLQKNHDNHLESATDDLAAAIAAGLPTLVTFLRSSPKGADGAR